MISKTTALPLLALALACAFASPGEAAEGSPAAHQKAGYKAFAAENYFKAAEELAVAIQLRPDAKAALYLGNAYLKLGQLGKAKEALELVLQLDPADPRRDGILKLIQSIEQRNVGVVKITSTPAGATVYVHEKSTHPRGKTPLDLSLPPGTHRVIAELEGHEAASAEVKVQFAEKTALELPLRPLGCELSLAATPAGSRAAVDGQESVAVPAKVRIGPGDHRVVFSGQGLRTQELPVRCPGASPLTLSAALVALPPPPPVIRTGIEVGASVPAAELSIDDQRIAAGKPIPLPAGPHHLRARATGYRPLSQQVSLVEDQVLRADVRLVRPTWQALGSAVALTALAITAESAALAAHYQAASEIPDGPAYRAHRSTEVALHITAGGLAVGAIVGYVLEFTLARSSVVLRDKRTSRIGAVLRPGGPLGLIGQF